MDSMRIEMRSLIKIKDYLTRNDRLIPDIRENDKTPSWDGEIIVYSSKSIAKKDILGRVPVQIKGSVKNDLSQNTIKYTLDSSDFRNYLISNGAIVFVVYMKGFEECKIFYNALLPFDLTKLIDELGDQKTKTIELHEFPKDNTTEVVNVFIDFITHQKLQGGTIDPKLFSLEKISELGFETDGFHFTYPGVGLNSIPDVIDYSLKHPTYIYVKPKGLNIKVPIEKINPDCILSEITLPIIVEGEILYNKYKASYKIDETCLQIGKSFKFILNTGKISIHLSGTLSEQIVDLRFLIALLSNEKIEINGVILPDRTSDLPTKEIKEFQNTLDKYIIIKSTLKGLGVKEDLDIENLSEQESIYLYYLVRSFHYKENVPLSINDSSGIGNIKIGNLILRLYCNKVNENKYKLFNFFSNDHGIYCTSSKDPKNINYLCPYILLKKDCFLKISNLNYNIIIDSIKKTPKSNMQDELSNQLVLEILKAYDEQKEKNTELLKTAKEIMEWLCEQATLDSTVLTLNTLQVAKRMRELSPEELDKVSEIKLNTKDIATLVGASILLESFVEAKLHYNRLPKDQQEAFDAFPISNLWINKDNK